MSEWFVYSHEEYYPYGCIVEADTAAEAAKRLSYSSKVVVLPADVGWASDPNFVRDLRDEGARV